MTNDLEEPIKLYWVDYDGGLTFYQEVYPDTTYEQATMETHPWNVKVDDKDVLVFICEEIN